MTKIVSLPTVRFAISLKELPKAMTRQRPLLAICCELTMAESVNPEPPSVKDEVWAIGTAKPPPAPLSLPAP